MNYVNYDKVDVDLQHFYVSIKFFLLLFYNFFSYT